MDWRQFLDKKAEEYDRWQAEGKITNTSKVIPICQALEAKPWVMPTEQVMHFIKNSRVFAVANCKCRELGQHCDRPLEVCFYTNDVAEKAIEEGRARALGLAEAEEICKKADQAGLVPTTLFNPEQHVFALCHCCPCCCHDLQLMQARGREGLMAHSEYIAVQQDGDCSACGVCADRCYFEARVFDDGGLVFDPEKCFGCGLCVTTCPEQAISMALRRELGPAD